MEACGLFRNPHSAGSSYPSPTELTFPSVATLRLAALLHYYALRTGAFRVAGAFCMARQTWLASLREGKPIAVVADEVGYAAPLPWHGYYARAGLSSAQWLK